MGKLLDEFDNNNIRLRSMLAEVIIKYRESHDNMSQGQFAALIGSTKTTVSHLETGYRLDRQIRRETVERIEALIENDIPSISRLVLDADGMRAETSKEKKLRIAESLKKLKGDIMYKGKRNLSNFEIFMPFVKGEGIKEHEAVAKYIHNLKIGHRISPPEISRITGVSHLKVKKIIKILYGQGKVNKNFSTEYEGLYTKKQNISSEEFLDASKYIEKLYPIDLKKNVTLEQSKKLDEFAKFDEHSGNSLGIK